MIDSPSLSSLYIETKLHFLIFTSFERFLVWQCGILSMIDTPVLSSLQFCLLYGNEDKFLDLALYYGAFIIFYFTANASVLLILFKYARIETTCHFSTLFSEIVFFRMFGRFPLTVTFRSVTAFRYGILSFLRDLNCLVPAKS